MGKSRRALAVLIACVAFQIGSASAAAVYTYSGQAFTSINSSSTGTVPAGTQLFSPTDRVTGQLIVLGGPLAPNLTSFGLSASILVFSDGLKTLFTSGFRTIGGGVVSTDGAGNIIAWNLSLESFCSFSCALDLGVSFDYRIATSNIGDSAIDAFSCLPSLDPSHDAGCGDTWGLGQTASNTVGGVWAFVPEPSAWALMITAFAGLGMALRHRRFMRAGWRSISYPSRQLGR